MVSLSDHERIKQDHRRFPPCFHSPFTGRNREMKLPKHLIRPSATFYDKVKPTPESPPGRGLLSSPLDLTVGQFFAEQNGVQMAY